MERTSRRTATALAAIALLLASSAAVAVFVATDPGDIQAGDAPLPAMSPPPRAAPASVAADAGDVPGGESAHRASADPEQRPRSGPQPDVPPPHASAHMPWEFRIADPAGEPVAGARVRAERADADAPQAVSGPDGVARLTAPGETKFTVTADGYLPRLRVGWRATGGPAASASPLTVVLTPAGAVGGVVRDSAGRPIAGATLRLEFDPSRRNRLHDLDVNPVRTGDDGRFRADGLPLDGEPFGWGVTADGFLRTSARLFPGNEHHRIVLERGASVSGVIRLSGGLPARRALAWVEGLRYPLDASTTASCEIPHSGEYTFTGLPPGALTIVAVWPKLGRPESPIHRVERVSAGIGLAEGETRTGFDLVLRDVPVSFLRVRVERADGRPEPNADLEVEADGLPVAATTDWSSGLLSVELPAGTNVGLRAVLDAESTHGVFATGLSSPVVQAVTARPSAAAPIVLSLPDPVRVVLRAEDADTQEPIAGARLELEGIRYQRWDLKPGPFLVDPAGSIRGTQQGTPRRVLGFLVDPAGSIRGRLMLPGRADFPFEVAGPHRADGIAVVPVPPGAGVTGRITSPDGVAVPVCEVFVSRTSLWAGGASGLPRPRWTSGGAAVALSDASGIFRLGGLSPGEFVLCFRGSDTGRDEDHRMLAIVPVTLPDRGVVDVGSIRAWPLTEVRGMVSATDGTLAAGARVQAVADGFRETATADARGRYRIRLPAGPSFRLVAEHSGLGWTETVPRAVPAPSAVENLVLAEAGAIRIRLHGEYAAASSEILVRRAPGGARWTPLGGDFEHGDGPRAVLRFLDLPVVPAGDVVVRLHAGARTTGAAPLPVLEQTVTVRAGETVTLDLGDRAN